MGSDDAAREQRARDVLKAQTCIVRDRLGAIHGPSTELAVAAALRDAREQALVELRGKVVPLLGTNSIAECLAKMRKFPNFTHPELVLMAVLDLLDPSDANGGSDAT